MPDISKETLNDSIIKIDEKIITNHLSEIAPETIEQTL